MTDPYQSFGMQPLAAAQKRPRVRWYPEFLRASDGSVDAAQLHAGCNRHSMCHFWRKLVANATLAPANAK
jgi:methylphosphotriester-DNA--protein-cysteine methyltransferase